MNPNRSDDTWKTPNTGLSPGVNQTQMDGNENYSTNQNTQHQDPRNPTYSDGYTMIQPKESARQKLLRMSQKEENDLQRWKEQHRPGPIHLAPEKLGGNVSLSEVRQKQQTVARHSKLQKKLRKEEMDRSKRQEEEKKNQLMKDIQRERATKLEVKIKQEEEQRKKLYQHEMQTKREAHLQRLERSGSVPMAASSSTPASSWALGHKYREDRKAEEQTTLQQMKDEQRRKSQILEEKHKQEEEDRQRQMENERLRVNSAFLDRLEARGSGRASELLPCTPELSNVWQTEEPQDPASSHVPFPSQLHTDSAAEEDTDIDWVIMKLQSHFSYCEPEYLEEIVVQCNGNYQQAYDLLNITQGRRHSILTPQILMQSSTHWTYRTYEADPQMYHPTTRLRSTANVLVPVPTAHTLRGLVEPELPRITKGSPASAEQWIVLFLVTSLTTLHSL